MRRAKLLRQLIGSMRYLLERNAHDAYLIDGSRRPLETQHSLSIASLAVVGHATQGLRAASACHDWPEHGRRMIQPA